MKPQVPLMPVIPAAGLLSAHLRAEANIRFVARSSSGTASCPDSPLDRAPHKSGAEWLYAEDEYFPFDAGSFEER